MQRDGEARGWTGSPHGVDAVAAVAAARGGPGGRDREGDVDGHFVGGGADAPAGGGGPGADDGAVVGGAEDCDGLGERAWTAPEGEAEGAGNGVVGVGEGGV